MINIFIWSQQQATEFPGIYHPTEHFRDQFDALIANTMGASWIQTAMATIKATIILIEIIGQPKRLPNGKSNFNLFNKFFKFYVDQNRETNKLTYLSNSYLPADYCYFGINDGVKNLLTFLKHNPLLASTLTAVKDPNTGQTIALVIDPYANDTMFGLITQLLNDNISRVVAVFTRDLILQSLRVFEGKRSTMRPISDNSLTANDKAYLLLNTLVHYAQHIHACIHVSLEYPPSTFCITSHHTYLIIITYHIYLIITSHHTYLIIMTSHHTNLIIISHHFFSSYIPHHHFSSYRPHHHFSSSHLFIIHT